jgi:hypothetical protein
MDNALVADAERYAKHFPIQIRINQSGKLGQRRVEKGHRPKGGLEPQIPELLCRDKEAPAALA